MKVIDNNQATTKKIIPADLPIGSVFKLGPGELFEGHHVLVIYKKMVSLNDPSLTWGDGSMNTAWIISGAVIPPENVTVTLA